MKLRITQDHKAGATYIYLTDEKAKHSHTICLPNGMNVDYDIEGNVRGIEILDVITRLEIVDLNRQADGT